MAGVEWSLVVETFTRAEGGDGARWRLRSRGAIADEIEIREAASIPVGVVRAVGSDPHREDVDDS
ncbi:MAG TPA: hypothetical protein VFM88_14650, partial [Vicinamibacteria bacterium]|nr:hypothetical protein [Vicinamibacteria bacterium]